MYDPAIALAYYLDPKYCGKYLSQDHSIISYILEEISKLIDEEFREQLTKESLQYHSKSGPFVSEYLWTNEAIENPIIWWEVMQTELPIVGAIASKLMLIPASSAASERNWSHFGFIHSLKRNRLTNECVFKLVSVYSYYKTLKNSKIVQEEKDIDDTIDDSLDLDFIIIDDDSVSNKTDSEIDEYEE